MALGTILGSIAAAGISALGSKLLGGKGKSDAAIAGLRNTPSLVSQEQLNAGLAGLDKTAFPGFSAGGLTAGLDANGRVTVGADGERLGALNALRSLFPQQAAEIAALRARVAPGMSGLRASRLGEIESSRSRAIGNLRENLQRRRVLGSSFAQDTLSNAEAEFAQQRDRVAAESFLQELDLTNQLLDREFQTRANEFNTTLTELNLEAGLAAELSKQFESEMNANAKLKASLLSDLAVGGASIQGANARTAAELQFKSDEGAGSFVNELLKPIASAFSGGGSGSGGSSLLKF